MTFWRPVEINLPTSLSVHEVVEQVHSHVRLIASEAGEFVHHIRITGWKPAAQHWRRWSVAYLPGPPGTWPDPVDLRRWLEPIHSSEAVLSRDISARATADADQVTKIWPARPGDDQRPACGVPTGAGVAGLAAVAPATLGGDALINQSSTSGVTRSELLTAEYLWVSRGFEYRDEH